MSNSKQYPDAQRPPGISGNSAQSDCASNEGNHEHRLTPNWREINRVVFVAAAAGAIWFLRGALNPYVTAIGVACTLVGGFPIFHEAYENISQRRMTMELSMAIAIVAALAIREIFTALIITLFVLVAEILEGLTVGRRRRVRREDDRPRRTRSRRPRPRCKAGVTRWMGCAVCGKQQRGISGYDSPRYCTTYPSRFSRTAFMP
jgi:cation transport ATPase